MNIKTKVLTLSFFLLSAPVWAAEPKCLDEKGVVRITIEGRQQCFTKEQIAKFKADDLKIAKLFKEIERDRANPDKAAREERAKLRSQGVRIGMSQEDVRASSWGKPNRISRTVSAYGIHEQWIYDGGYLYFEDGVLKTIQN